MPIQTLKTLAKLAHDPSENFTLETEFGLRIDVSEGKFKVRLSEFEDKETQQTHEASEAPVRNRTFQMEPVIEDYYTARIALGKTIWRHVIRGSQKNGWRPALEWELTGRKYILSDSPYPRKGPNKPRPAGNAKWNSWTFQGGMLACWLALQHDVAYVNHWLWEDKGTFTHENAGDELQRFLKGYPWVKKETQAGKS